LHLEVSFIKDFRPKCEKGKISSLSYAGLIPHQKEKVNNAKYCGDPSNLEDIEVCTRSFLNYELLESDFNT
jgi:hypothetical protein